MCQMCNSVFLAQVIGVYLVLIALSMFFHQTRFKKVMSDFMAHQALLTLSGSLGILFGLLIVLNHNIWVSDWPVLITLIGWIALLQGASRLLFPDAFGKFVKEMTSGANFLIWSWIWLIIGVYLIWMGWTVVPTY